MEHTLDDAKSKLESRYKSTKAEVLNEYNKEKKEIGNKVEVRNSAHPSSPSSPSPGSNSHDMAHCCAERGAEVGGRWYSAFGGFGGLGLHMNIADALG